MSRPFKKRKICCEPLCMTFRPEGTSDEMGCVVLLLDEYETIRLIDFEGLSQDQCARQMQVARSTVQNIYDGARKKIAMTIVLGLPLHIEGGNVTMCDGNSAGFGCRRCGIWESGRDMMPNITERNDSKMIVAVPYDVETGEVFQHFGKSQHFKVYALADGKVQDSSVYSTNGQGHGALAGVLAELEADALICGGIGGGAQSALAMMGIRLFNGVSGSADAAVEAFLAGQLTFNPDASCHPPDHDHDHEGGCCGHHDHDHDHEEGCCH